MTQVICTECGAVKEITSRSVVLPFVCDECQRKHEDCIGECCETIGGNNG